MTVQGFGPDALFAILCGLGVPALIILGIWGGARLKEQRGRNLVEATQPYGGRVVPGDWLTQDHVEVTMHGIRGRLTAHSGSKNNPSYTRLEFGLAGRGRLRVTPQGFFIGLR